MSRKKYQTGKLEEADAKFSCEGKSRRGLKYTTSFPGNLDSASISNSELQGCVLPKYAESSS